MKNKNQFKSLVVSDLDISCKKMATILSDIRQEQFDEIKVVSSNLNDLMAFLIMEAAAGTCVSSIDLSDNEISLLGFLGILKRAVDLPDLRKLDLSYNGIVNEPDIGKYMVSLGGFEGTKLSSLNLESNYLRLNNWDIIGSLREQGLGVEFVNLSDNAFCIEQIDPVCVYYSAKSFTQYLGSMGSENETTEKLIIDCSVNNNDFDSSSDWP
ncbi:MAG: hypothetical protein DGJ47_000179 [Rickettsiaceae bacterium]